ncbi:unnamed protein product [Ectocarpus sp. CCAP 1310/34]|nr:unnamed protein product [Ectocarpus sp. CCAP 1310/34]
MEVGPPSLVDVTRALVQTLPVNERIHKELRTMGGRLGVRVGGADDGKDDVDGHDEHRDEERLRLGGERETVDGDASGVGGVQGGGKGGCYSTSGREVVEVDWATLLDGSRVLELLYRLEVVYTLVEPEGDVYALPGDRMDASEWVRVFLETGGMQHLLGLLGRDRDGDNGIDPSQSLHKACLAALLKLIAHFTSRKATPSVDGVNGGAKSAKDVLRELYAGVDLPKLVQRMLVVMHEVSRPTAETVREHAGFGGDDSNARYGHHNAPSALAVAAVEEADGKHRPPPQAEVVQHTMSLLCTLTELQPELSSVMLSSPGLGPALEFSLLHTPEKLVRREVSTGVLRMAISLRKTSKVEQYESRCDTYLNLVGWLIGQSNAMPPNEQADLCLHLADLICARPVVEQSEEDQDPVLAGYMTFLKKALKTLPDCRRAEVKATAGADVIPPPPPATAAAPTTSSRRTSATAAAQGEAGVGSPSAAATKAVAAVTTAAGQLVGGMWGAGRAARGGKQEERGGTVAGGGGGGRGLVRELVERCLFSLPHERGSSTVSSSSGSGVEGGGVGILRGGGAGDGGAAVEDGDEFEGIPLPKCKSDKSREVAFILLNELATGCAPNLDLTVALVGPQHFLGRNSAEGRRRRNDEQQDRFRASGGIRGTTSSSQSAAEDRDRDMDMDMGGKSRARAASFGQQPHHIAKHKSKTGFVGLKNMGCICYMNSTLQQLFMVPEFREGVLDFRDHDQTPPDDSLMWQLQNMFSHLQESEKAHFNPVGLVRSLRDWEGQALDVMVQQDASEFITQFFQQVEGQVMGSASENILKQCFGGVYSNELLAEGGLLYSERPEPFSYISVEVKNMKTLAEALEVFTAEEVVSFKWDKEINAETGERQAVTLNTKKRCSIKSLPNYLLIHLKRFDFDFDTMQQTKINDRLEFPIELNMYPYTKEGRAATTTAAGKEGGHEEVGTKGAGAEVEKEEEPAKPEEYYHYHLAGVVVHMGTANSGHYYSYIRPRDGGGEWLEFNDTVVSTFDVEDMEAECFGGEENSQHSTSYQRSHHAQQGQYSSVGNGSGSSSSPSSAWRRERTRNAFMLVYDRVMPEQQQGESAAGEGSGSRRRRCRGRSPGASPRSLSPPPPPLSPTAAAVSASPGAGVDGDGGKRGGKGRGGVVLGPRRRKRFRARVPAVFMRQIHWENLEFWRRGVDGDGGKRGGRGGGGVVLGPRRRKRFRARVPAVFMRQIHWENLEFWRKKNVLDKSNYAFLQKLVFQATDEDGVSTASALRLACRFTLGTLVQAQERELMTTWAGMVRQHLPLRPEACRWLLKELGGSPSTLKELLLSPEESVRYAATSVATAALQRCMQAASNDSGGEPGGGGGPGGDGDDAYTAAYAAAIEARDRREFPGGQGGTAEEFVALGGGEGVPSAEAAGDNDAFLAQKTGLLSLWGGRQEAMASSHRVGKGQIGSSHRESEKAAAAAAAVVVFVDACLGLLSVAPSINQLDWARSEQLLSILAVTAEAGPSERSHLLQTGALGALMSMFLGDDSPYPELVRSPCPRPRLVPSGDGQVSSPASPRRPYRCPCPPAAEGADGGEGRGLRGVGGGRAGGRNGAKEYYDATKDFGEDQDLSALLKAISPLVLASELAWGESASSDTGTAGGTAAPAVCFSPVALRPLSRMSEEEKQMLTSPAFLMRLIMLLREPKQKDQLIPLLQHLCWRNQDRKKPRRTCVSRASAIKVENEEPRALPTSDSFSGDPDPTACPLLPHRLTMHVSSSAPQLVTKVVIINICQRIEILRDVDAHLSKPGFRALMIILSEVPDGLQQWRLDLAVSRVLEIMEEHTTLTVVTEQMESWLNQAMLAKQKHGANAGSRYYGARMNGPPTSVSEDKVGVHWREKWRRLSMFHHS